MYICLRLKTTIVTESTPFEESQAWFETWFDSPYYHTLYASRDEEEARAFIDAILYRLQPAPSARMLDLACGQGRYSRYLASKGFAEVVGLDLSVRSIREARKHEANNLSYYTHDMRLPYRANYFDFIFNFFTSFGYFEQEKEDLRTLQSVRKGLRPEGVFVLDFFNAQYVIENVTGSEKKEKGGILFNLRKEIRGNRIIKEISFTDREQSYSFTESVRLYFHDEFDQLFEQAGLTITERFGDYHLHPFDSHTSPRLILIARRS
jgi:SAM-dependent methyltransferase